MKRLLLVLATLSLFSCEHHSYDKPEGVERIWFDNDGKRHRTFTSKEVYLYTIDGVPVKYIKVSDSLSSLNIDSLINAE